MVERSGWDPFWGGSESDRNTEKLDPYPFEYVFMLRYHKAKQWWLTWKYPDSRDEFWLYIDYDNVTTKFYSYENIDQVYWLLYI